MNKLIEALQFLLQFMKDPWEEFPTHCEHDILYIWGVDFSKMSLEDARKLDSYGFMVGDMEYDTYKYFDDEGNYMEDVEFDLNTMTEKQWEDFKETLSECVTSYHYGSC